MELHDIMCTPVVAPQPPMTPASPEPCAAVRARLLGTLLKAKEKSREWMRNYEIPGRKLLYEIIGEAYAVYLEAEGLPEQDRDDFYRLLSGRLRDEKVRMHADAPKSAVIIRTVFRTLDNSRVSKYARTLDAVRSHGVKAEKFVEFVKAAGGIEKVQFAPVRVLVPGKPATPESFKEVVAPNLDESEDDLTEDEVEAAEYVDELYELLEHRKANPFLTISSLSPEQRSLIDQQNPQRVVLVAELVGSELRVFEQVPFVEDVIAQAFRVRYPSCDLLRQATNEEG